MSPSGYHVSREIYTYSKVKRIQVRHVGGGMTHYTTTIYLLLYSMVQEFIMHLEDATMVSLGNSPLCALQILEP